MVNPRDLAGEHRRRRRTVNPRDLAGERRRRRTVNPRDLEGERRRRRTVNPRDLAGEHRRRRRMVNPRDIAGEHRRRRRRLGRRTKKKNGRYSLRISFRQLSWRRARRLGCTDGEDSSLFSSQEGDCTEQFLNYGRRSKSDFQVSCLQKSEMKRENQRKRTRSLPRRKF